MASLNQAEHELPNVPRLLASFDSILSQVSFPCDDIFDQPLSPKLDVPRIPEPVYTDLVTWINREIPDETLSEFVVWSFGCISDSELPSTWTQEGSSQHSKESIFAVLALIMRSKPDVLRSELPSQGKKALSLTVWMIKQASQSDLHVGLYSWVRYLLPLLISDLQWKRLILELVEIIFEKPGALTKLEKHPVWGKWFLIPLCSFENLLRLKFSATSPTVIMDTTRFVKIYGSLKRVALAGALKRKEIIQLIFTVSLRLAGEGNPVLAKEAAEMAYWSLTENNYVCWRVWYKISKENRAASVFLLKTLLEKWNKHSLKLPSSSPRPNAMNEFIQGIFSISMAVADEGNTVLAREATKMAIWSLAKNFFCWACWGCLYRKNLDASLGILETLVNDFKVHSPKLSSREGTTKLIIGIFTFSLRLAGEGNPIVARKAAEHAIWAMTQTVLCWRRWYYLYEENLKATVFLLETLLQDGKYDFHKLSSRAIHTISQTLTTFSRMNNDGIAAGGANGNLYKEADKSCKVILGRLSPGNCSSLRGAFITDLVLLLCSVLVLIVLIVLTVFGWI